jgi:hypothetical protein
VKPFNGELIMKKKEMQTFDRGSALSIFGSDRKEDLIALILAFTLALVIYLSY